MADCRLRGPEFTALCEELLSHGRAVRLSVWGGSMAPTLVDGDVVHVAPCVSKGLALGDLVLFRSSNRTTVHRVLELTETRVRCGGDAQRVSEWIEVERVLGRVTKVERPFSVRRFLSRLRSGLRVA